MDWTVPEPPSRAAASQVGGPAANIIRKGVMELTRRHRMVNGLKRLAEFISQRGGVAE